MTTTAAIPNTVAPPSNSSAIGRFRGSGWGLWIGLVLVVPIVLSSLAAPLLFPGGYDVQDLTARSSAPTWTGTHPLGTDHLGRDYLTRLAYGGRSALYLSAVAVILSTLVGVGLALLSALRGGWVEVVVDRIADIQLALPSILVGLVVLALAGPSTTSLLLVLTLGSWVLTFRVVRAHTRALISRPYIDACRLAGGGTRDIVFGHLLPNTLPLVLVSISLNFSTTVLLLSGFGFLGLGVQPPTPDWGQLIAAGQAQLANQWWLSILPGILLIAVLVGVQLIADWLSERLSVTSLERT